MQLPVSQLSPMQEAMGESVRQGNNVILLSPTGSGKTLAYMIPICERLLAIDIPQTIVIVPSRELAQQSEAVFASLKSSQKSISLYGGRPAMEEHRKIKSLHPAILFATPGRLLDHLQKENFSIAEIQTIVLDEFDKCLELGFQEQIEDILTYFPAVKQVLLTSATQGQSFPEFMLNYMGRRTQMLDFLSEQNSSADRLAIYAVPSVQKDKLETLAKLLSSLSSESSIVFLSHRESVERVYQYLQKAGFAAEMYHGGMQQEHREHALFKFRTGCRNILISTDLAARGLDIPEVRFIVHYHLPLDEATFTHRNGRTARWESAGKVYILQSPQEQMPAFISKFDTFEVENTPIQPFSPLWTTIYIGRGKQDKLSKGDIVGFLCKKGGLKMKDIGKIELSSHHAYAAVSKQSLPSLLRQIKGEKIKGMRTIIEEMKK